MKRSIFDFKSYNSYSFILSYDINNRMNNNNSFKITLSMRILELIFITIIAWTFYCLVTLNYKWIIILTIISIVQSYVQNRSHPYIDFIVNKLEVVRFFNIKRYYQQQIPDQQKTMFSFHPHSVYSFGVLLNLNYPDYPNQKMSKMNALSSRFMLGLPLVGFLLRIWGILPVDAKSIKKLMEKGKTIGLVPGGYEEATLTSQRQMRFFIKNRKGFIKYALKYGYTIRPVIIMNQHKAYQTIEKGLKYRMMLNKLKFPGVFFWSKYGLLFPPNIQINTIIGKGIKSDKQYSQGEEPTVEEINKFHQIYVRELIQLYENNKDKNQSVPLKIF